MKEWYGSETKITAIRMDDRLLHGIITTQWAPRIPCDRVMVIDDVVANDVLKKEVMKLAKPVNKALSIINREMACKNFRNHKYDGQRLFILSRDFRVLSDLQEMSCDLPDVNIGLYYAKQPDVAVSKRVVLSREDLRIVHSLLDVGCRFQTQYVPSDEKVELSRILYELK